MKVTRLICSPVVALLLTSTVVGCATKASVKPRSKVLELNNSPETAAQIVARENAEFLTSEVEQRKRLRAIISARAIRPGGDLTYRIGALDELQISVFDVPELQGSFRVSQDGLLTLPLVGSLPVKGLTENEAMALVTQNLSKFVRRPQVTLSVNNFSAQQVAVLGAVNRPGNQQLRKGVNTLLEVLSIAGGVRDKAGNYLTFVPSDETVDRSAYAIQQVEGRAPAIGIDIPLDQVLGTSGGLPLELEVRGGDTIIIPEAGKINVEGEVDKPGSYDLGTQMTVLSALAAAGGFKYSADPREIEIVRDLGFDKKLRLVMDLQAVADGKQSDVRLRNGDIVRVPTDPGKRMTQDVFEGLSRIVNFGIGGTVNVAN